MGLFFCFWVFWLLHLTPGSSCAPHHETTTHAGSRSLLTSGGGGGGTSSSNSSSIAALIPPLHQRSWALPSSLAKAVAVPHQARIYLYIYMCVYAYASMSVFYFPGGSRTHMPYKTNVEQWLTSLPQHHPAPPKELDAYRCVVLCRHERYHVCAAVLRPFSWSLPVVSSYT